MSRIYGWYKGFSIVDVLYFKFKIVVEAANAAMRLEVTGACGNE
jgi:hypothetical protein